MVDRVEVLLNVDVHHKGASRVQMLLHPPQSVFGASLWPEPIAAFHELLLKDRLDGHS